MHAQDVRYKRAPISWKPTAKKQSPESRVRHRENMLRKIELDDDQSYCTREHNCNQIGSMQLVELLQGTSFLGMNMPIWQQQMHKLITMILLSIFRQGSKKQKIECPQWLCTLLQSSHHCLVLSCTQAIVEWLSTAILSWGWYKLSERMQVAASLVFCEFVCFRGYHSTDHTSFLGWNCWHFIS